MASGANSKGGHTGHSWLLKIMFWLQSKVTPVKWLEPTTPSEIENAINEDRALVIVPIAFVSDHSETLVELDIEYQELASELGCKHYYRSESLNIDQTFIESLSEIVSGQRKLRAAISAKNMSSNV